MRNSALLFLLTFMLAAGVACAGDANFVSPTELDGVDMLPPPAADDSAADKAELAQLHQIEMTRTPADVARAQKDAAERDIFIFEPVLGEAFSPSALPLTAALSRHVEEDIDADVYPIKRAYHRTRPYNFDKSLHPVCATTSKNNSYPSGHTVTAYVEALVLASMLPEKRDAIFVRADDYAHDRLVCGAHHASDLEAGKRIAYAIFALMAENARFKAERSAAEAEIRKALELLPRAD